MNSMNSLYAAVSLFQLSSVKIRELKTHGWLVFKFNLQRASHLSFFFLFLFLKGNPRRRFSNTLVGINGAEPSVGKEIKVMATEIHCTIALYAQRLFFFENYLI